MLPATWRNDPLEWVDTAFRFPFFETAKSELPTNVSEHDDKFVLEVSVPGIDPKDVKVEYVGKTLYIEAKRPPPSAGKRLMTELPHGTTQRAFRVEGVDADKITAKFNNGLLVIEAPKAGSQRKTIPIV